MVETWGPLIDAVCWALLVISAVFLALRLYCKKIRGRGLWYDDYILIFAWLCVLAATCCVSVTTAQGFGSPVKQIDPLLLPNIGLMGLISSLFSILAAIYSKTSFAFTLYRISQPRMRYFLCFIMVTVNLSLGGTATMGWISCTPVQKSWNYSLPGKCWDGRISVIYGIVAGVYSGCMDIVLALLPWKIISILKMKKQEKCAIALAMSMGVFAGGAAITKSAYIPLIASKDFSYYGAPLICWAQAESAVCIMAASIPQLRVLIRSTSSTYSRSGYIRDITNNPPTNGPRGTTTVNCTSEGRTIRSLVVDKSADGSSSKSILDYDAAHEGRQGIIQLTEISVINHQGDELDSHQEFNFGFKNAAA